VIKVYGFRSKIFFEEVIKKMECEFILTVKRGDIFYADLSPVVGSEQGGLRPVLIIQNDVGNKYSPTVIAAAITSKLGKSKMPTHIDVYADKFGLAKDSVILLEQIRTIDKKRLKEKMGHLDTGVMQQVNDALSVSFGLSTQGTAPTVTVGVQNGSAV
jgi:mRNA interferase MazF